MDITKALEILNAVQTAAGDILLSDAISWLQVEENANSLLAEGHEEAQPPVDGQN